PLTVMKSVGEVALRSPREAQAYREAIGSMLEEVDGLARLADGLLLLSRADAEELELARERVDLARLTRDAVARLEGLREEKGQRLVLESADALFTEGDPALLRQALLNLIDNAIKYSPRGTRALVRALRAESEIVLEVRDAGPGIAVEHRDRIFDRFYRVDP